jgi:hypothetical protein
VPDGDARSAGYAAAIIVAAIVATTAFAVYSRTLLPGIDLGDTGGFQAAVLWPETSARQAYPLYYALARPFVRAVSSDHPARGLNLFSAVCGALAAGLLAFLARRVTGSTAGGVAAGLLLAISPTFWSQAIIAEVYALHLALVGGCLVALHAFAVHPSTRRLVAFFAVYALSFGNHLTMILLFVPFSLFLLQVHPSPRVLLRARTVCLALLTAAAGALLYLPNFLQVWTSIDAPPGWADRAAAFWFDTTKADWREAMVLGVSAADLPERIEMWLWDARQQFGLPALGLALAGLFALRRTSRPWALLVALAYGVSTVFAVTYNVGDPHVFFLASHLFTAFAAGAAVAWIARGGGQRQRSRQAALLAFFAYAGWLGWETWPAVDRHNDRRADLLVARLAAGLDETNAVLLSQMDWQSENALLYAARYDRPQLAWTRLAAVLPHLPFFVRDNQAIGRDIVLTSGAAADLLAAYGPLFPLQRDNLPAAMPLSAVANGIPRGSPYILTLLTPMPGVPLDESDFDVALGALTAQTAARGGMQYQVWAGLAGEREPQYLARDRPFDAPLTIAGDRFGLRIDGWVPFDDFRRGGFGRVLRGREPLLIIERGASLVWLNGDSSARTVYSDGLYAPAPRFRIPADSAQQLAGTTGAMLPSATPPG